MNLPNKLTILRILLIPVFVVFATQQDIFGAYLYAGIIFAAASFTDFLDGAIARKHGLVTNFGKFADPLADKIITTVAFIYMMMDGVCAPLVLVIIISREFAVSGVRMLAASSPNAEVIAANMWGKVKTVLQMLTIVFYYIAAGIMQFMYSGTQLFQSYMQNITLATNILCWLVAIVTAASGVQYIWGNRKYIDVNS